MIRWLKRLWAMGQIDMSELNNGKSETEVERSARERFEARRAAKDTKRRGAP